MSSFFEVGKCYGWEHDGLPEVEILKRTAKTIWVRNESNKWMMRVRHDEIGEYAVDSNDVRACGSRYRDDFTLRSAYRLDDESTDYLVKLHNKLWSARS